MTINAEQEQGEQAINNLIGFTRPKQETKQKRIRKEVSEFLEGLK